MRRARLNRWADRTVGFGRHGYGVLEEHWTEWLVASVTEWADHWANWKIGDKVDFWVVERSSEKRLTLRAEMRLPGDALFDLKVACSNSPNTKKI
ncbi:MAG: hypothetical protein CM1200mP39_00480 [Dehalococcoidia bacterium]|nr:MAG: hypothetical protein CM1200mP39_00480 [Dehalococcoidia bacterium]